MHTITIKSYICQLGNIDSLKAILNIPARGIEASFPGNEWQMLLMLLLYYLQISIMLMVLCFQCPVFSVLSIVIEMSAFKRVVVPVTLQEAATTT